MQVFFLTNYFDFQEYDNEAETLVSSLSINYDDEDIDIGESINNYNRTCILHVY